MPKISIVGAIASTCPPATSLDARHHLVGVVEAVEVARLDDDVGEDAVEPVAHLLGEAGHDALTTIIVATPSITLMMLASAM